MVENTLLNTLNQLNLNSKVLLLWSGQLIPDDFRENVENIRKSLENKNSTLNLEHAERLNLANYSNSTFDCILSNIFTPKTYKHDSDSLYNLLKLLKPKGILIANETESNNKQFESEFKLNGFTNVKIAHEPVNDTECLFSIYAEKPNFEVGSVKKLNFSKNPTTISNKIWKLNDDDIGESDLIDTDALLDENDLKKPVFNSKFDCGSSDLKNGVRKACKNCTCGLAEELENEATGKQEKAKQNPKSACGSCYLGDAFRCASCPYLGMPAFKPGEKVQLNERLLNADK